MSKMERSKHGHYVFNTCRLSKSDRFGVTLYAKHTKNSMRKTPEGEGAKTLPFLQENSFQFNGKDYLQTHGTAMGTKMAVAFANIFMAKIEKEILRQSTTKPIFCKRFIDDVMSIWNTSRDKIEDFLEKANSFHPTIKFTVEISETETTFLDTKVYMQR